MAVIYDPRHDIDVYEKRLQEIYAQLGLGDSKNQHNKKKFKACVVAFSSRRADFERLRASGGDFTPEQEQALNELYCSVIAERNPNVHEYDIIGEDDHRQHDCCCSKSNIMYLYYIINKTTKNVLRVGSHCITKDRDDGENSDDSGEQADDRTILYQQREMHRRRIKACEGCKGSKDLDNRHYAVNMLRSPDKKKLYCVTCAERHAINKSHSHACKLCFKFNVTNDVGCQLCKSCRAGKEVLRIEHYSLPGYHPCSCCRRPYVKVIDKRCASCVREQTLYRLLIASRYLEPIRGSRYMDWLSIANYGLRRMRYTILRPANGHPNAIMSFGICIRCNDAQPNKERKSPYCGTCANAVRRQDTYVTVPVRVTAATRETLHQNFAWLGTISGDWKFPDPCSLCAMTAEQSSNLEYEDFFDGDSKYVCLYTEWMGSKRQICRKCFYDECERRHIH